MKKRIVRFVFAYRKFVAVFVIFLVWVLFFDNRSMLVQHKLNKQINLLENEQESYGEKLDKVRNEWESMQKYPEKYAREKYFMHKSGETVYIYSE